MKGIIFYVCFVVWMVTISFAQEDKRGTIVPIKKMKDNAGKRWAICIGINDYVDSDISDLKKARNDAKELGKVLKEYGQFDHVYVMTDDLDPKGSEYYPWLWRIKRKMRHLKDYIAPEDLVLFSFSGHGITKSKDEGYLLTADSYIAGFQENSLKVTEIIQWLQEIKVKKSLLLLDACREQSQKGKVVNLNGLKPIRFSQAKLGAVFYATEAGGISYEDKDGDFGVFTRYVIDGLKGKADSDKKEGKADCIVTFSELAKYVEEGVSNWALNEGKSQKPHIKILEEKFGDLALSVYEDKPAPVKVVKSKEGWRVDKNDNDLWEAEYVKYGIVMVYIPAGQFTMGSKDGKDDEKPPHKVSLDGYFIGKYEVTFAQYDKYCEETLKKKPKDIDWGRGKRPVINVSWDDAHKFCKWLSDKTGLNFKLPTEAQWEKAARGTDQRLYPWGNSSPTCEKTNYKECDNKTQPVGSYPSGQSPYGLMDMAGNVWEWCQDWYSKSYYKVSPDKNPGGPSEGTRRVFRGGGWESDARACRAITRDHIWDYSRSPCIGFRLVIF